MRNPIRTVWRSLMFVLGVGIRVPAVILAVWGGAYVVRCANALAAPGVPVEYRYMSQRGEMLITAEAYNFDFETLQGFVQRVHVYGPNGDEVASADMIDFALDGDVSIIRLNDPLIRAKRLKDGSLDVLGMLPFDEKKELTGGAFRIVTSRGVIEFSDESLDEPPIRITLLNAGVDGAGGTYMFRADLSAMSLNASGGGSFTEKGKLIADARIEKSELKPLLVYLSPFLDKELLGEFASIKADSLVVDGVFSAWSDPDSGLVLTGTGTIEGRGVTTAETLRNATVVAKVSVDSAGLVFKGTASQKGISATFDGTIRTGDKFHMTGALMVDAESESSLPPLVADYIEPGVTFKGAAFDGNMDTDGEQFLFDGAISVAEINYGGETTTNVAGRVRLDQERIVAQFDRGEWSGVEYSGAAQVIFKTGALSGGIESKRGRIEPIAQRFGTDRIRGVASINAVLVGTISEPAAEIYARGSGGVLVANGPLTSLGEFELRGRIDGNGGYVERLTTDGQNGTLSAHGSIMWEDGALDFVVNGGGLDVSAASDNLKGLGFLKATVGGTRENPKAEGRLEVYGFETLNRKVPQIVADWTADGDRLTFERITARAGTGQIDAQGTVLWADRSLNGVFSGSDVRLEEWLAKETVGAVGLKDGLISGTLDDPQFSATLYSGLVYAGGVEINSAEVRLTGNKALIESSGFRIVGSGGELSGAGSFDVAAKTGSVASSFKDVPLSRVPLSEYSLLLDGMVTGDLSLKFDEEGLTEGSLTADVDLLKVNDTAFGQGWVQVGLLGKAITAEAQVGSLDRYVLLSNGKYNTDTREIGGEALVYNVLLEDVIEATGKAMKEWPHDLVDLLENTKGLLNAGITVSGNTEDPTVVVDSLVMTELEVRGRDAGELRTSGRRDAGVWTISQQEGSPLWIHGDTKFFMNGTLAEDGTLGLKGDLYNFHAEWVHTLFPSVPLFSGEATLFSFNVSGPLDDPTGHASINTERLGYFDGDKAVNLPLKIDLDSIEVSNGVATLLGNIDYQGLKASVDGSVPFSSLYDDPDGREGMDVKIQLHENTSFAGLAPYMTLIDAEKSVGKVTGKATIKGLVGELAINAELHAEGDALALTIGSLYRDIVLDATWKDEKASFAGTFKGENGGTGLLSVSAAFPDLFTGELSLDEIKRQTTLDGNVKLDAMRLQFILPSAESASGATFATQDLKVTGTIASPKLSGNVALNDVFVRLPDEFAGGKSALIYPIDPSFENLTVTVGPGARIVTDNARIVFFGSGRVGGSLQNPDLSIPLTVTGGRFDMPTARITLEEGGSIVIGYRSALGATPTARVDLNLEGHTTLSARRTNNEYEAYQIQLLIRGNLLEESGLRITASSDPPDLSSDQIMAILGQKELIEGLVHGGSSLDLRGTIYTVGLPSASNALSAGLAQELGLDYISIDYNPFDLTVVGVGKVIGKGLMLQANRQLAPNPGERLKYELQLTYRLPMEDAFFSRVRLSLGLNQDVPWRLKLNWSRRF